MLGGLGTWVLAAIVVVVVAAAFALLHFRFGMFQRRRSRGSGRSRLTDDGRVEVLERTRVDAERQLLLVRCDQIEHLILVGGPADVVVENDVKKVRGPASSAPKAAIPEAAQHSAAAFLEPARSAAPRAPQTDRPGQTPAQNTPAAGSRSGAPSAPARPAPPQPAATGRRPAEPQFARSGSTQHRRAIQPSPLGGSRAEHGRSEPERPAANTRGNGRQEPNADGLPAASVPWAEPDSIENEIVQALRVDPVASGGEKPRPQSAARDKGERSTTLGDLAEQLEEALAEEVRTAGHGSNKQASHADPFAFGAQPEPEIGRHGRSSDQSSRAPRQETGRQEAVRQEPNRYDVHRHEAGRREETPQQQRPGARGALPEPEQRRETQERGERREEAPVISLNARRREAADPLEDEMARLLGELTGDTKGR